MTTSARQSELFAGEVWDTLYQAFPKINFNASDPVSINLALRDYIRINYPESFNDWIVSSEFVAIIDLLSWLAGVLAFKTDIAARENFLDTAEARESILRLARFLSYNPSRCSPASGILKITQVATDDDVYDSFGVNLANTVVFWNDPNNSNWFEQYCTILNNAFASTNPFGVPLKNGTVSNINTQLYRINGLYSSTNVALSTTVSGIGMSFEVCNGDFTDEGTLFERPPNPNSAFQIYYLNDGNGNASAHTGFFVLFKQGITGQQTFQITVPVENQLLYVNASNVNNNDVWVQTVNDSDMVIFDWTKVPAMFDSNITFNRIPSDERNIFSVLTRDSDQVTIRFSDGRFGNAPFGNIRVTYRTSNGLTYQVNPQEISNHQIPITYANVYGVHKTLRLTVSLMETVANAASTETIEQIRQRAPQVYGTQNRMVSGEDYNTFPLSSNSAIKIKAVNRIYAGQSRYIHDPTGTYQDLSLFADDGIFFRDITDTYIEVPSILNKNARQIITDYIEPALEQYTTTNLIRDVMLQNTNYVVTATPDFVWTGGLNDVSQWGLTWISSEEVPFATTGHFSAVCNLIEPGAIVQFNINGVPTWVGVIDIQGTMNTQEPPNTAGPVTLAHQVQTGSAVLAILPVSHMALTNDNIKQIANVIDKKLSFTIWYSYTLSGSTWVLGNPQSDFGNPEPALVNGQYLLLMCVNYVSNIWRVNSRGLRYVFESIASIEWYDNGKRSLAQLTGEASSDLVRIMRVNRNLLDSRGYAQSRDYNLSIDRLWLYPDATPEPRRSVVMFYDGDRDGIPDDPDLYYKLIPPNSRNTYLFWSSVTNQPYDVLIYAVKVYDTEALRAADAPTINTVGFQITGSSYLLNESFWLFTSSGWVQANFNEYRMERGRGPNVAAAWVSSTGTFYPSGDQISFHWKHYAPSDHRIDPSSTNIHDIFVLTAAYVTEVEQWIANGADVSVIPLSPSELELQVTFADFEQSKMFSDTVVWRPVSYKYLFGNGADDELRAQFKVVRLSNIATSDGEIKSRIIRAIDTYFDVTRWDFGETFYFTELAAYIHQQLVGMISSVVIVPLASDTSFGDDFEISCRADEIFISTAQVSDIIIIPANTAINLRIR